MKVLEVTCKWEVTIQSGDLGDRARDTDAADIKEDARKSHLCVDYDATRCVRS